MQIKLLAAMCSGTIAIGILLGWLVSGSAIAQQPSPAMPPPEVTIKTIQPKSIDLTRDLPGRTTAYKIAEIRPQVNGIIVKRLFEEGSEVKAGQQLYQIDQAVYQAAYDSAQADVMKAEANAKSIVAKSGRFAELVKIGGISKQEYDDIQAGVAQANADIAIARAALANAKINLDYTKVFSPIDGRIGKSMVTEGALVTQNQQMALSTVQQLDPIYVDVTQSSSELLKLRKELAGKEGIAHKKPVTLFLEGQAEPFSQEGEMQFSDVSVDETTGSIQLRILFPNQERELLPGMFVTARIGQSEKDSAILVPQKATIRNPDGSASVTLVDAENKVSIQPIKVADAIEDQWLVTEGLKQGDRVIVEGYQKVKPKDVVKPVEMQEEGMAPPPGQTQPAKE